MDDLAHRLRQATGTLFIRTKRQRVEAQSHRLTTSFTRQWREARQRLSFVSDKLDLLSPKSTLSRGYCITLLADTGRVVRSASTVTAGTKLTTKLLDGEVDSVVSSKPQIDESR